MIVIKDLDHTLTRYLAMVQEVGESKAAMAFSRALNHEGKKTYTALTYGKGSVLAKQTDIPWTVIRAATQFKSANKGNLRTIISGTGKELPLRLFKPHQFKFGVKAKVWGKWQSYKSAFIIAKYDGNVFHRTSSKRFPIEKMYGPSVPKELVKDESLQTFEASGNAVMERALHELRQIMRVK